MHSNTVKQRAFLYGTDYPFGETSSNYTLTGRAQGVTGPDSVIHTIYLLQLHAVPRLPELHALLRLPCWKAQENCRCRTRISVVDGCSLPDVPGKTNREEK